MADGKKYILDGYRFNDSDSYEQARRELNKIAEIKAEKDLKDETVLREIYDNLVESGEFSTPVGIGFLREAQRKLVKNPEQRKTMKAIPYSAVLSKEEGISGFSDDFKEKDASEKDENTDKYEEKSDGSIFIINNLKSKIRNYRIIIAFMAVMVLVPFGVVIYDKFFSANSAQEALVNEYASWKEELTKKEQELNEREKIFEGMADKELNSEIKAGEEENGESQNSGS